MFIPPHNWLIIKLFIQTMLQIIGLCEFWRYLTMVLKHSVEEQDRSDATRFVCDMTFASGSL